MNQVMMGYTCTSSGRKPVRVSICQLATDAMRQGVAWLKAHKVTPV